MTATRFLAALVFAAAVTGPAAAQAPTPSSTDPGPSAPPVTRAPLVPDAPSKPDLEKLFSAAGYKFKTLDGGALEVYLGGKEGWRCYPSLSKNGKTVWVEFPCSKIPGKGSSDDLRRLLAENDRNGTAYFAVGKDGMIRLWISVPTAGLTKDVLRDEVEYLGDVARRTEALWDTAGWADDGK